MASACKYVGEEERGHQAGGTQRDIIEEAITKRDGSSVMTEQKL